ncbi:MAG TPA: hypothetical protein VGH60_06565 [Solirubrobacteraceae bacterium]|jgi:hypothetical protein
MYQFSRAIYRELSPHILPPAHGENASANHERVLHACEAVVERMATDRHYFAYPARTLYCDIRSHFAMSEQGHVHRVVNRYIGYAQRFLVENPVAAYTAVSGQAPQCRATTRKGSACQRVPLPHNGYCPSHQHLAETEDRELAAA